MPSQKISVSIHECLNASGYVVKLTIEEGNQKRIARFPCDGDGDTARAYTEAVLLMESIRGLAETGDVDALLPDPGDDQ